MAKFKTPFNCLCGHKQDVTYKKPSLFQCTPVSVTCQECDSIYFVKFKKDPKLAAGMIGIEMRLDYMSPPLKEILEAQQADEIAARKEQAKRKDQFRYGDSNVRTV